MTPDDIAATLAAHRLTYEVSGWQCGCGWSPPRGALPIGLHEEHVAEALAGVAS